MNKILIKIVTLPISILYWSRSCCNKRSNAIRVMTAKETVESIVTHNLSVSRFGDGEILIIKGKDIGFQPYSPELSKRLEEVLNTRKNNHIVCIPRSIVDLSPYTLKACVFWKWSFAKHFKLWLQFLKNDKIYGDSLFTRFYIDMKDKTVTGNRLAILKTLWNNRDLLIVEGLESRLGIGNDLFDNAHSVQRILCPSRNAFSCYERIKAETLKFGKRALILIALGPTATVLAYDLAEQGYQAIDIGHIDIEYEWYLRGTQIKIPIKGKFVNECHSAGGELKDNIYQRQIVSIVQ
ncbi:SP_1767 family glycosyltransferase [Parabacteroides sp.]|uniref:SP_1767 family glycosyltransferase n=1 Tax=Parabacteroides sp. TaxID=1869337 RepID=UPI00257E35EA|nr:SP_1767 family glycosyltransferase [Parabacteroides sp.]